VATPRPRIVRQHSVRDALRLDEILEQFPNKVVCAKCGKTVGHYRPGRVAQPSLVLPTAHFKCFRPGCHFDAVVVLSETIEP
jgi:hypothetical protein